METVNMYEKIGEPVERWAKDYEAGGYWTDMVVRIRINDDIVNELLIIENDEFVWLNDWWEGQQDVELLGFIPVDEVDVPTRPKGCIWQKE